MMWGGSVYTDLRGHGKAKQDKLYETVSIIYRKSTLLENWVVTEEYNHLTSEGMILAMTRIFTLAALLGPMAGMKTLLVDKLGVIPKDFLVPVVSTPVPCLLHSYTHIHSHTYNSEMRYSITTYLHTPIHTPTHLY